MSTAVRVENLGKRYRVALGVPRGRFGYRTLRDDLARLATAPLRLLRRGGRRSEAEDFWALEEVGFQVRPGEVVGVIGRNGAGKSTLLKILSRITKPTVGRVELRGRVGSLLEVGTGFHPELTGRENIYLNGAILGMPRRDIERRFDEIVAFAEVERFLETPVKRYSSGMYVRLAFAVAAHLETDVLLVDEVLAVGDAAFQKKCLGKMSDIQASGRTILFVSHSMAAVEALCPRAIFLDAGKVVHDGESSESIRRYLQVGEDAVAGRGRGLPARKDGVVLEDFHAEDGLGKPTVRVGFLEPFKVVLEANLEDQKRDVHALITLWRRNDGCRVASITSRELRCGELGPGRTKLTCHVDNPLLPGDYYWSVSLRNANFHLKVEDVASMSVAERILPGASHPFTRHHGVAHICSRIERDDRK